MKYLSLVLLFVASPVFALSCPEGQMVQNVMVSPEVPAGTHIVHHEAVTHVVHHEAVTHTITVVDSPAYTSCDYYLYGSYSNSSCTHSSSHWWDNVYKKTTHPAVTHTEVVVDTPAYDETIIDTPAYDETITDSPAIPAVYEDQCVIDPNWKTSCDVGFFLTAGQCVPETQCGARTLDKATNTCVDAPIAETKILSNNRFASSIFFCFLDGTCPCMGFTGEFLNACIIQKYPQHVMCELKPIRSCAFTLPWQKCTPEPYQCK